MDKRIEKTKEAITQAYLTLQKEKTGNRITVSDIARKANIDRKTFYLHYDTVEDIVKEYARDKVRKVMEEVIFEDSSSHPFHIDQLFDVLNRTVQENQDFFRFVMKHCQYNYFFEWTKDLLCSMLMDSYRENCDFKEAELRAYTEFYISAILSTYAQWLDLEAPYPLEELTSYVKKATFYGLYSVIEGREKKSSSEENKWLIK